MLHQLPSLSLATLEDHMVLVKGGEFEMSRQGRTEVSDFFLCRFPVTQLLWREVMGKDPKDLYFQGQQRPVECVSWDDCQDFLQSLNKQTSDGYRLPTEAEWEYAAREGKHSRSYEYAGSPRLEEVGWYRENSFHESIRSGYHRPNALGLYDLSGNVWERCQDAEWGDHRVSRGGSWLLNAGHARVSVRLDWHPDLRNSSLGFRLARSC